MDVIWCIEYTVFWIWNIIEIKYLHKDTLAMTDAHIWNYNWYNEIGADYGTAEMAMLRKIVEKAKFDYVGNEYIRIKECKVYLRGKK